MNLRWRVLHKNHPLIYDNFNVKGQLTCTEKANAIPANAVGMLVRITSSPVTATTITQIKSRRIASQRLEAENRKKGRELVSNSWWNLQYTTTQITLIVKHYMYMYIHVMISFYQEIQQITLTSTSKRFRNKHDKATSINQLDICMLR